jgi:hypothetical protein
MRLLPSACVSEELAEADVAASDEGAHTARLGERQRLVVVGLSTRGIETVGMGCDVAEQVQRMGGESGVTLRNFDRTAAQASRLVEPVEPQTSATQRVVAPGAMEGDPLLRLTLESGRTVRLYPRNGQQRASIRCRRKQAS